MILDYPTYQRTIGTGYGAYSGHTGCDFVIPIGTPIYAPADGTIIEATEITGYEERRMINGKTGASVQDGYRSYGRKLVIQHAENTKTLYAHLSKFVKTSGKVKKGELVAYSGNAGNVRSSSGDGAHLHFEVIVNGVHQNPINYLGKNGPTNEGEVVFDDNAPAPRTITYTKMKGTGTIINDYTDIYWYIDNSNKPKPWGFYGMAKETIDFIGKVDNYYYGWINGICQSRILGLVPVKKVKKGSGKILSSKGSFSIGGDSNGNIDSSITLGRKFSLTDNQLKGIAYICSCEQGTTKGAAAEASLMANRYDLYNSKNRNLYEYVRDAGWWADSKNRITKTNVNSNILEAVRDVLTNGNRTLPLYIDEHDWIGDISSVSNGGKSFNKTDRSSYKPGTTVIKNKFGATYTFYCFPDTSSDPFGYTSGAYKKANK